MRLRRVSCWLRFGEASASLNDIPRSRDAKRGVSIGTPCGTLSFRETVRRTRFGHRVRTGPPDNIASRWLRVSLGYGCSPAEPKPPFRRSMERLTDLAGFGQLPPCPATL